MSIAALLQREAEIDKLMAKLMTPTKPVEFATTMKVGDLTLKVGKVLKYGDICDLYPCTYEFPPGDLVHAGGDRFDKILEDDEFDEFGHQGILKFATDPFDDDLVRNEAEALSKIYPPKAKDEKFYRYLPKLITSFKVNQYLRERTANLLPFLDNYVSLADVIQAYPTGVPHWEDAVWMVNRALEGIGFVHSKNWVHASLIPEHVMIHPRTHGAKLIDWSYATEIGDKAEGRVRAMVRSRLDYMAPEVRYSERVTASVDIFAIAKLGIQLLGGNVATNEMPATVPATVQKFFKAHAEATRRDRPVGGAWDARDDFEDIVVAITGPRKFRPFKMPAEK